MANEDQNNGGGSGAGDGSKPDYSAFEKELTSLKEQVGNLNSGIAGYRDRVAKAESDALAANKKLEEFQKKIEFEATDDDETKLAAEDEKKLKAWAESKGFVTDEQLQAERNKSAQDNLRQVEATAVESFLNTHPDVDTDEKWTQMQTEFKSWYRQPASLSEYKQVLNKIYTDLFGKKEDGHSKARAEIQANKRLQLGGGSQRQAADRSGEDDVETLMSRYPNLTRDQIEDKIAEVNSLYTK